MTRSSIYAKQSSELITLVGVLFCSVGIALAQAISGSFVVDQLAGRSAWDLRFQR